MAAVSIFVHEEFTSSVPLPVYVFTDYSPFFSKLAPHSKIQF